VTPSFPATPRGEKPAAVEGAELLNRRVVLRGDVEVGRVVDVILERASDIVLGLDVLCRDGEHRFVPITAADAIGDRIAVESPFTLLDEGELDFYRERGRSLRSESAA